MTVNVEAPVGRPIGKIKTGYVNTDDDSVMYCKLNKHTTTTNQKEPVYIKLS